MMEPFLNECIKRIAEEQQGDLGDVTLVFNNQRPALFVKQYMQELFGNSFFLPKTIVFDDLVAELGCVEILPNEFLLFELYDIHHEINKLDTRSLEQFIPMADMMLSDFSEIDRYLVDAKDLYGNLHDIKEIGEWDVSGKELTPFQKNYLRFYKSIYSYYIALNQLLDSRGQAYYGMAYRKVAENIESILDERAEEQLYFLGFNALSKCEKTIINAYVKRGRAKYLPDGDNYYVSDSSHEAGKFIRDHLDISAIKSFDEHFNEKKTINIVKAPDNVTQAKYAGTLLSNLVRNQQNDITLDETALVLADESLITTVLNSLPEEIATANVTMGIPFSTTDMHSLALSIMALYAEMRADTQMFYHKTVTGLLGNPYVCALLGSSGGPSAVVKELTEKKFIYANIDNLRSLFEKLDCDFSPISFLFEGDPKAPFGVLDIVRETTVQLQANAVIASDSKEMAALECLVQVLDYLDTLKNHVEAVTAEGSALITDVQTLRKIYLRIAQRRHISLKGSPKSGLQILGVLETRNLDFRRVILLSANEGVIPSARSVNTLIPNSLKKDFKMPTYYEKDAVYAYNFYHLMQRAEDIYLISESGGKNSESRFVQQVRAELAKRYNNIKLTETTVSNNNTAYDNHLSDVIVKTDEIMARLAEKSFSPSSLNTYRDCPFRFFYENLLKVSDEDEISDVLEKNELGTAIHECLKEIYLPYIGQKVDREGLRMAIPRVPGMVDDQFNNMLVNGKVHEGKNDLLRTIAITQITNFLEKEIAVLENHSIVIEHLEEVMKEPVTMVINGRQQVVRFWTTADRIDRLDGQLRVIDYKSGKVEKSNIEASSIESDLWRDAEDKWFQVMFYSWYYSKTHNITEPIVSGLCPLQKLGGEFMPAKVNNCETLTKNTLEQFEEMLKAIFSEMFNHEIPFRMKDDKTSCKYCTIAPVCKRLEPSGQSNVSTE